MSLKVVFRPIARRELEEAAAWYDARRRGLGAEFKLVVQGLIAEISEQPTRFRRIRGELRRAVLRRFPYMVVYLAERERLIVFAVFHTSRDVVRLLEREQPS